MFDIIRNIAARLMKDANLPALQRQASDQRMGRKVPTEALTYYPRALLYSDPGQKDKAVEMFNRAIEIFPGYAEAKDGLQGVQRSKQTRSLAFRPKPDRWAPSREIRAAPSADVAS